MTIMNETELIRDIKEQVAKAANVREEDAVNMYLVVKYADQLKDMDAVEFALSIGRKKSYASEFRKGLNLARVIKERGL